jgi:hypothetical protein
MIAMKRVLLICALLAGGCRKAPRRIEPEPPAAAPARRETTPEKVKREAEQAEQRHEERIDKAIDRADEQR